MNIRLHHRAIKIYLLMFSSVLLYGCSTIKEDMTVCRDLDLKFEYHMEGVGFTEIDFIESIDFVQLYIFDKQLEFLTMKSFSTTQIQAGLAITVPEDYFGNTMVALAREMLGYYDVPTMKVGDHIDLLTLKLKTDEGYVSSKRLADLFHGGREIMTFDSNGGTTQIITFHSTSKQINLSLFDTDGVDVSDMYEVKLTARNGYYKCDNTFLANSPMITYIPCNHTSVSRTVDSDNKVLDIRTLRLKEIYKDDVILTIVDKATGVPVEFRKVPHLKLIDYLLKTGIPGGMTNQEYLDAEHFWELSITVITNSNLAVSLTIDDWTMWFNDTEL